MDNQLLHFNWAQATEVFAVIAALAFIVERALAVVFESSWYEAKFGSAHIKEILALWFSMLICWYWDIDLLSVLFSGDKVRPLGVIVTAAVVAGGSKASIKLFRDVLGVGADRTKTESADKATTPKT